MDGERAPGNRIRPTTGPGWRSTALLLLALPGLAAAHMDDRLTCDVDGFRMTRAAVSGTDAATAYDYRLTGRLQVPTPGYRYELLPGAQRSDMGPVVHHLRLVLTPPDGISAQVISDLAIDAGFRLTHGDAERLIVSVEKTFNWGPDQVLCVVPFE